MAVIGNINLGLGINAGGVSKGLSAGMQSLQGFGSSLLGLQGILAGVFTGATAAAIYKMAGAAAHLNESIGKQKAVFGEEGDAAEAAARQMSGAYGMSLSEILDKQAMLGASLRSANFSEKAAANYADVFGRLANDMTRRWDIKGGFAETFEKIMAGLRGSSEPLQALGVTFNEKQVEARAYQMGLARVGQTLSEGAKIQARATLILEQGKTALRAAADEADSTGAQMEALGGRWENLTTTIGETFAPVVGSALGEVNVILEALRIGWVNNRESATNWAKQSLDATGATTTGLGWVTEGLGKVSDAWQVMSLSIGALQGAIMWNFKKLSEGIAWIINRYEDLLELMTGERSGLGEAADVFADSLNESFKEMQKQWQQDWKAPWASEELKNNIADAKANLKSLQDQLAAKPMKLVEVTGAKGTQQNLSAASGKAFAGAMRFGSAEAASTVLRSKYGGRVDEVGANTKRTADGVENVNNTLLKINQAIIGGPAALLMSIK